MSVECVGESTEASEESVGSIYGSSESTDWNGREVTVLLEQKQIYQLYASRVLKAQEILQNTVHTEEQKRTFFHHVEQLTLDDDEEIGEEPPPFSFAPCTPLNRELIFADSSQFQYEIILSKSFLKKVWREMKRAAKKAAKSIRKLVESAVSANYKIEESIAHGTKKAAEKVADFVKEHKKEILITTAVIAAIAGAYVISGALGKAAIIGAAGSAATAGAGSSKRKDGEDNNADSPSPSDPPLPDWAQDLLKATAPNFSPSSSKDSLEIAKKEAHDAWRLFDQLKYATENDLAPLRTLKPEFDTSSHTINTIINSVFSDPKQYEISKNLLTPQNWPKIMERGHEIIDKVFSPEVVDRPLTIAPTPPVFERTSPGFINTVKRGLEIIGRAMSDPKHFDLNLPVEHFIKNETLQTASTSVENLDLKKGQTVGEFLTYIDNAIKQDANLVKNQIPGITVPPVIAPQQPKALEQSFFQPVFSLCRRVVGSIFDFFISPIINVRSRMASTLMLSQHFITEGTSRDDMLITFINGMNTSYAEAIHRANHIRSFNPNLRIDGIYNHSNGVFVDSLEIFNLNYYGISPITKGLLIQKWTEFHEKNKHRPDAKILHFCHSQGAIHTKNALEGLPKEIRDRIIVVSIGPAEEVPSKLCYDSSNYASELDFVHKGERLALYLQADNRGVAELEEFIIKTLPAMKSELILLVPHKDAKGHDHDFESPTFYQKIEEHLEDYIMKGGKYP